MEFSFSAEAGGPKHRASPYRAVTNRMY